MINEQVLTNDFLVNSFPVKIDTKSLDLNVNRHDSLITIIAILNTDVCPSCITNTLELLSEAEARSNFSNDNKIIFIDESEKDIERFIQVTNLDYPVLGINSKNIDPFFYNKSKYFVFINSTSDVIHSFPIPVAHASVKAINNEIDNVIKLSKINTNLQQN